MSESNIISSSQGKFNLMRERIRYNFQGDLLLKQFNFKINIKTCQNFIL